MEAAHAVLWSVDVDLNELGKRWATESCLQKSDTLLVSERSLQSNVEADLEGSRAGRGRPVRRRQEGQLGSHVSENSKDEEESSRVLLGKIFRNYLSLRNVYS